LEGHYNPLQDAIKPFVQIDTSASDNIVRVDIDRTGTDHIWVQISTISRVTNLTVSDLINRGERVVARGNGILEGSYSF